MIKFYLSEMVFVILLFQIVEFTDGLLRSMLLGATVGICCSFGAICHKWFLGEDDER